MALGPYDDFLIHQTLETLDVPETKDERWMERFWFGVCAPDGRAGVICGMGRYPNTEMVDGLALGAVPGRQHNLRAWRPLDASPWTLDAHPLTFEILEPMRRWRIAAAETELGVAYDLTFTGRTQAVEMPKLLIEKDGHVVIGYRHFVQSGRYDGWLKVGGERFEVDGWLGERDRSWGLRNPSGRVKKGLHIWMPLQLPDSSPWIWIHERPSGRRTGFTGYVRPDGMGEPVQATGFTYELDVREVGPHRLLERAEMSVELAGGGTLPLEAETLLPVYIAGGGYADEAGSQGRAKDPPAGYDGESWPTATDADLEQIPITIIDHFVRVRSGASVGAGTFELAIGEFEPMGFS